MRRTQIVVGALAIALVLAVVGGFLLVRSGGQLMTAKRLRAAEALWQAAKPSDYDIEVQTTGPRAAIYHVQIRRNKAVAASIDGRPIQSVHALETWSVPGMFDTIQSDLDSQETIAAGQGDASTPRVVAWGEFHTTLGYPLSYRRAQKGAAFESGFRVTKFETKATSE